MSSFTTSKTSLTFLQHPTSQTVQQGGHVTLNCTVSAQRRISYEWKHNNKTIRTNKQSRFTITSDGSLRITKADLDDSGIYQCTAILTTKRSHTVRKKARSHTAKLTVEGTCGRSSIFSATNRRHLSCWLPLLLLPAIIQENNVIHVTWYRRHKVTL